MERTARLILCAGQYGSASTWLYNAVHALAEAEWGPIHRQFADSPDQLPEDVAPDLPMILKSHAPSIGMRWLLARTGGRVILSIREPRDAVASLLGRFELDYGLASRRVQKSAETLPRLLQGFPCLLLRYEDGFFRDQATLGRIAAFLGLAPSPALLRSVFDALTPDAVRARIDDMLAQGRFGPNPTTHSHDGVTHWHPGHVGDGQPGKFASILTPGQQGDVARRTRDFQRAFDYPIPGPPPIRPGSMLPLEAWGPGLALLDSGFGVPDEDGAWTEGEEAWLDLPMEAGPERRVLLDLELPRPVRPKRPVVNPMRWSLWQEGIEQAPLIDWTEAAATPLRQVAEARLPAMAAPGTCRVAFRFQDLAPAHIAGVAKSRQTLGLRLRAIGLSP